MFRRGPTVKRPIPGTPPAERLGPGWQHRGRRTFRAGHRRGGERFREARAEVSEGELKCEGGKAALSVTCESPRKLRGVFGIRCRSFGVAKREQFAAFLTRRGRKSTGLESRSVATTFVTINIFHKYENEIRNRKDLCKGDLNWSWCCSPVAEHSLRRHRHKSRRYTYSEVAFVYAWSRRSTPLGSLTPRGSVKVSTLRITNVSAIIYPRDHQIVRPRVVQKASTKVARQL